MGMSRQEFARLRRDVQLCRVSFVLCVEREYEALRSPLEPCPDGDDDPEQGHLKGGMGNVAGSNGHQQDRERLFLSPHCLGEDREPGLFDDQ